MSASERREGRARRWRPTRAGILNVWEYDDQVFEFGDGRLVLRGRNGSGKSNALAVLMPFVLDGVMSAARMDPMGGARSMKSLLLGRDDDGGGAYKENSATGYVWLEFGDGEQHLTIGVGASATRHRDVDGWFFCTDSRIGPDVALDHDGVPHTRRKLTELLGPGSVFATAAEYRNVVDDRLFGLGPDRYRSLLDLLLTLRRPHLAGKLDTAHLSATLSAGLEPVSASLIDDVAHSFDDLDAMAHELEALGESLDAVERFLPIYRAHLLAVASRRADVLIAAGRAVDELDRDRRTAARSLDESGRRSSEAEASVTEHDRALQVTDGEIEAIQQSPAYRSAATLDEVARSAERTRTAADEAERRAQRAEAAAARAAEEASTAHAGADRSLGAVTEQVEGWMAVAGVAGLTLDGDGPRRPGPSFDLEDGAAAVVARRDQLDRVSALLEVAAAAEADAGRAESSRVEAETAAAAADAAVDAALTELRTALDDLGAARRRWTERLDVSRVTLATLDVHPEAPSAERRATPFEDAGSLDDAADLVGQASRVEADATSIDRVLGDLIGTVVRRSDATDAEVRGAQADLAELEAERARIEAEPNPGPPPHPARPDATDPDRSGVPLYACVDFADDVPESDRGGLEAALFAAGLLDARVGAATDDDAQDARLVLGIRDPIPVATDESPAAPTLADVLVPSDQGATAEEVVTLLASIPLDGAGIEITTSGRWRLGPLAGRLEPVAPRFIGHAARERRRAERLADVDARLTDARVRAAALEATLRRLSAARRDLEDLRVEQPDTAAVRAAEQRRREAETVARERNERLAVARRDAEDAVRVAADASTDLHRQAVEVALPADRAGLAEVAEALVHCGRALDRIDAAISRHDDARLRAEAAQAEADARAADLADERAGAERARNDADVEARRLETLRAEVGADADAALIRLADARRRLGEHRRQRAEAERQRADAAAEAARLSERIAQLDARRVTAAGAFVDAEARLVPVRRPEIAEVLRIEGLGAEGDPLVSAEAIARTADAIPPHDAGTGAVDPTNAMERAHREILLDGLRAGYDPSMPKVDGIDVVRVGTAEGEVGIGELAERLRTDRERTAELLSDHEREIFETHLLSGVSEALRRLLSAADEFEHRINAEMANAATASEMVVELRWVADGDDPGLRSAVDLLRSSPEMLGPEQRDKLREFFGRRIAELRADDPGRSYAETLAAALDYRTWHRFDVFVRFGDGPRSRVTRTYYRSLSGGEAATVLHLPLFAAAAAQYSGGEVDGPRLIALDEAFVGIDDGMRSRLMGLLTQLDLDVVLTSHEFWGFYASVPEIVVYDLARRPPTPGVHAQRLDWTARTDEDA